VSVDDVRLLARRNPSLHEFISAEIEKDQKKKIDDREKRKRAKTSNA
jgi:hypothetical protein